MERVDTSKVSETMAKWSTSLVSEEPMFAVSSSHAEIVIAVNKIPAIHFAFIFTLKYNNVLVAYS
jgi:hypothetical protein